MAALAHILDTERETRRFRLLALVVVSVTLFFREDEVSLGPALGAVGGFFVYTLLLGPMLTRLMARLHSRNIPYLVYGMLAIDAIAVTALVHYAGGITSITVILIPMFVMYHTVYLGNNSGLASAGIFSLLYLGAAQVEEQIAGNGALLVGQVGLFFLLALFSAYLGKRTLALVQTRDLVHSLIFDAGIAQGVHLEEIVIAEDGASCLGRAPNEESLERFLGTLQTMRQLSSVRLTPDPSGATSSDQAGRVLTFSLAARIR